MWLAAGTLPCAARVYPALALGGMILVQVFLVGRALAQAPVVQPNDISTPTPTPLFPTPTPTLLAPLRTLLAESQPTGKSYWVRPGDTVLSVALENGLDVDDVPCAVAPDFRPELPLVIGDRLVVPPANVFCHAVQPGETLNAIATQYRTTAATIRQLAWNRLAPDAPDQAILAPRIYLQVPLPLPATWSAGSANGSDPAAGDLLDAILNQPVNTSPYAVFAAGIARRVRTVETLGPVPADWPYGGGHFSWPVFGWLSQSYRYDHRAIDIAAPVGTPVTVADRGVVLRAGWNDQGYGRFVIVNHNIDYLTLYAHLDKILVTEGEVVAQGEVLGTVGSTGNSTGPHLHFEIRDFGRLTNPLELLALP